MGLNDFDSSFPEDEEMVMMDDLGWGWCSGKVLNSNRMQIRPRRRTEKKVICGQACLCGNAPVRSCHAVGVAPCFGSCFDFLLPIPTICCGNPKRVRWEQVIPR